MANVDVFRQIYNVLGLAVSTTPSTGYMFSSGTSGTNLLNFLPRVQSVAIDYTIPRVDVNQYGQLDRLDSLIVAAPTATATIDYLLLDGYAENLLGFAASGQQSFVSGLIDGTQGDKNYFLGISPEGVDLIGDTNYNAVNVVGLGNGYVSNYSLNLAVGQIPRASVTIESTNAQFYTGSSGNASPAINYTTALPVVGPIYSLPTMISYTGLNTVAALRPGDIVLSLPRYDNLGDYLSGVGHVHVQSLALSVPIALDNILELGNPYPIARKIRFPVDCTLTLECLVGDVATGAIANVFCNDPFQYLSLSLNNPNCQRTGSSAITLNFNQAKLINRNYSSSIGQNSTVRLTFQNQLQGISSLFLQKGIVFSGSYSIGYDD
jgi:hypothetical protein